MTYFDNHLYFFLLQLIWSCWQHRDLNSHSQLVCKLTLNHLTKLAKWLSWVVISEYLSVQCIWVYVIIMSRMHFRVNLHSIVAWMSRTPWLEQVRIWMLNESNGIRTHSYLVCKETLNYLAKLAKRMRYVVSTYLYGAFECMLLSCYVRGSE